MRKMRATEIAAVAGGTSPVILPKGGSPGNGPTFVTPGNGTSQIDWFGPNNEFGGQINTGNGTVNVYYKIGNGVQLEGTISLNGVTGASGSLTLPGGETMTAGATANGGVQFGITIPTGGPSSSGCGNYCFTMPSSPSSGAGGYGGSGSGYGYGSGYGTPWTNNQWDNYGKHQS